MVNIAGKYTLVSQDNFDAYLTGMGLGSIRRKVAVSAQPDVVITMEGEAVSIEYRTNLERIHFHLTLGENYEADLIGVGLPRAYVTTHDKDRLNSREVDDLSRTIEMKFDDNGFVATYVGQGYTATRTFKRA
ncbi:lipocalin/fatty-acid binding family protein [Limnospira fusiformis KN01]|uniref:lipocalin/fatty-acid binding family protein n=1 Tax=Limnospira TaxID=2596745 RepID=UPI001658ADF9|nr:MULTISPECIES: lipocalin/fatty-acid binding family protein [Limnospira]MDT9198111.1 lipocalin/fatty-acid binding family protein [Limnospira sp. PMC 1042.18]ULB47723.1 lipocalin/fatty-acid binding family protein [Limnospira fusiformis KN01]